MILVVAALAEEARIVLGSSSEVRRVGGVTGLVEARRGGRRFLLLRSGVGPKAAATRLLVALGHIRPSLLLIIGYAGALKHGLELGDLVAIERSSLVGKIPPEEVARGNSVCQGSWDLPASRHMADIAATAGLTIHTGEGLTSHAVVGDPFHKEVLHGRFGAVVVDMETAALAGAAESEGIPAACVRAITDPADDTFLKPFSYRSHAARIRTHANSLTTGKLLHNLQEWNKRTEVARASLGRFLNVYFRTLPAERTPY
jgi:nucleoside phosphorylase